MGSDRAEKSILSSYLYKMVHSTQSQSTPRLPEFGAFTEDGLFMYLDGFEEELPNAHLPGVEANNILNADYDSGSDDEEEYDPPEDDA
jgi:hypothetical protein